MAQNNIFSVFFKCWRIKVMWSSQTVLVKWRQSEKWGQDPFTCIIHQHQSLPHSECLCERERETWLAQHVVEADISADGWVHLHPGRHGVQLPVIVKLIQEFLKNTQHFTNMPMLLSFTPQSVWFSRSYVLREQSINIDNVFSKPLVIKKNIYA